MTLNFEYNKEKDVWCLLNKGKSSNNSSKPTSVYEELVAKVGDNLDEVSVSLFIDEYLKANNLQPEIFVENYQKLFSEISTDFQTVAERVFGVSLNRDITAYLTVNTRYPYNIEESSFFVSMSKGDPAMTMMHELWHFYTWEKFGAEEQDRLGKEKYNEIKEALTVLLNVELKHLLPEGVVDKGYPQHQELREKIVELWKQNAHIEYVWKQAQLFS
jgi:hypothetical protein